MPFSGGAWRVFPWDRSATPDQAFSPGHVPANQGSSRFDIRATQVLYFSESPEHAIGEKIQRYRGQTLEDYDLTEFGHPLALVECQVSADIVQEIADLCDWEVLARYHLSPDTVASRDLTKTQAVAQELLDKGHTGLRWWSALSGDWHSIVLFSERLAADSLAYGVPQELTIDHPAVIEAASVLGISLETE
jgi:hypothetical protein